MIGFDVKTRETTASNRDGLCGFKMRIILPYVLGAVVCCAGQAGGAPKNKICLTKPMSINLPEVIYAVPEIEANIYFDNILLVANLDNYIIDITCNKGLQQLERWTYTPSVNDIGEYTLTLKVLDGNNNCTSAIITGNLYCIKTIQSKIHIGNND